jgi:hypothetical protein
MPLQGSSLPTIATAAAPCLPSSSKTAVASVPAADTQPRPRNRGKRHGEMGLWSGRSDGVLGRKRRKQEQLRTRHASGHRTVQQQDALGTAHATTPYTTRERAADATPTRRTRRRLVPTNDDRTGAGGAERQSGDESPHSINGVAGGGYGRRARRSRPTNGRGCAGDSARYNDGGGGEVREIIPGLRL